MGLPSYMRCVVDRNVVMRRMTVFRDVDAELRTGITTRRRRSTADRHHNQTTRTLSHCL